MTIFRSIVGCVFFLGHTVTFASEVKIALDFDRTLVNNERVPYPKVGEFVAGLLALKPHPDLYIYSDSSETEILASLKKIILPDGTTLNQYIKQIFPKQNNGKDLTKISPDLKNIILIDNDMNNAIKGQEKNLLTFPNHELSHKPGPNYDYIIGMIREAIKLDPDNWTQKLFELQWNNGKFKSLRYALDDSEMFPEFDKVISSGRRYLGHVTRLFKKRTPFFNCVLKFTH